MIECKHVATLLDRNLKLEVESSTEECELTLYPQLVKSLIHLTVTWPDLNYSGGVLSQFMQTQCDTLLDFVKWVLRYVSETMDYDILYKSVSPIRLEGYTNADGGS